MLCFIEGGSRRSHREPQTTILPDATLGRTLYEDREIDISTRMAVARREPQATVGYQFGTPRVLIGGPTPMGRAVTSASIIALGPFVLATINFLLPTVLPTAPHQFPPLMTEVDQHTPIERIDTLHGTVTLEQLVIDVSSRTVAQIDQLIRVVQR